MRRNVGSPRRTGCVPTGTSARVTAFLAGASLPALAAALVVAAPSPVFQKGGDTDSFVPGEVLVKYVDSATPAQVNAALAARGLERIENVLLRQGEIAFLRARIPSERTVKELVEELRTDPLVAWAEPNGLLRVAAPNDTWCIDDPDPLNDFNYDQWGYYRVQADLAWDDRPLGASVNLVTVAVLDSGIDFDHTDAPFNTCMGGGCLWVNLAEAWIGIPGVDDDLNGYIDDAFGIDFVRTEQGSGDVAGYDGDPNVYASDPDNSCGDGFDNDNDGSADEGVYHGTHVAGIIATWTNNNQAFAGMAWNAEIMAVRVLSPEGWGSWADIAAGINYAADNGADVLNLSLGGTGFSTAVSNAVDNAHAQGCGIVCASGNDGVGTVHFPANLDKTIAVGATNPSDGRASFSNWGPEIDVVAPGVRIFSNAVTSVAAASGSFPVGSPDYYWANGTSMSTPMVSAVAANIFSIYGPLPGSAVTNEDIRNHIRATATDLPGTWDGAGLLNAFLANRTSATAAPITAASPGAAALHPNRPNPFGRHTTIRYTLGFRSEVRLEIFNLLGQRVRALDVGVRARGSHDVAWNGRDEEERDVASGLYLYRLSHRPLEAGGGGEARTETRKLTLRR